jgi:hypothetical protein
MWYQSMSNGASVHRKSTEKKGISWEVSRTAGIPQNQKSLASGSAYRARGLASPGNQIKNQQSLMCATHLSDLQSLNLGALRDNKKQQVLNGVS